jgi:DNA-binding transcriptional MerR regulator
MTAPGNCRSCIPALKELGLSLKQIGTLLKNEISPAEFARDACD